MQICKKYIWRLEMNSQGKSLNTEYYILYRRPQNDTVAGISVISVDDFLSSYNNEWVIISSRKYRREMEEKAYRGGGTIRQGDINRYAA